MSLVRQAWSAVPNLWERVWMGSTERDRVALVLWTREGVREVRYQELIDGAEGFARRLHAEGIEPGDRCVLVAENQLHWCTAVPRDLAAGGGGGAARSVVVGGAARAVDRG